MSSRMLREVHNLEDVVWVDAIHLHNSRSPILLGSSPKSKASFKVKD